MQIRVILFPVLRNIGQDYSLATVRFYYTNCALLHTSIIFDSLRQARTLRCCKEGGCHRGETEKVHKEYCKQLAFQQVNEPKKSFGGCRHLKL